jgi:hypothetical protein
VPVSTRPRRRRDYVPPGKTNVATAASLPARRDVPSRRGAFTLTMVALTGFGVALLAALWILSQALSAGEVGVATELRATADRIDAHASAMADHGERLLAVATAGTGVDRALWMSEAQHMISDADSLRTLATRLRVMAVTLGERPEQSTNASASVLSARAAALRADAVAATEHGRMMTEHAALMLAVARQPGSTVSVADAELMSADAGRIIEAGQGALQVAGSLDVLADQLRGMFRR